MDPLLLAFAFSTSLVLLAAGAGHAVGHAKLRSHMRTHQLLGSRVVWPASVGVPAVELLVAIGAVWSVATTNRGGLVASLIGQCALFCSFAGYLALVVRAGNAGVPCGCGPAELPVGRSAIARAITLAIVSGASAVGVSVVDPESLALRSDARGLLACAAGFTLAVLLVILAPTRRLERGANAPSAATPPVHSGHTSDPMTIGSA